MLNGFAYKEIFLTKTTFSFFQKFNLENFLKSNIHYNEPFFPIHWRFELAGVVYKRLFWDLRSSFLEI